MYVYKRIKLHVFYITKDENLAISVNNVVIRLNFTLLNYQNVGQYLLIIYMVLLFNYDEKVGLRAAFKLQII